MLSYQDFVAEMNNQHDILNQMLQKLEDSQDRHFRSHNNAISDALNAMSQYAANHFRIEEEAMKSTNYTGLEQHKEAHRFFLKTTADFCLNASLQTCASSSNIISYLRHWLETHVEFEDKEMTLHLKKTMNSL